MTVADLVRTDREYLIHPIHDHTEPVVYVRGRAAKVYDADGREYLDGLSGLWNVNVGHGREQLAEAASAQMKELAYFSAYAGSSNIPAITLAERLSKLSEMAAVFFTCGGAESNESAFKTARFYWKAAGRPDKIKVIARAEAYHGVTLQAMSATKMGAFWKMFEPRVPGFVHVQTCYPYRFDGARSGETIGQAAARELEEAILREGADTVAAFIGEPIHGAGGVIYPDDDYWPRVRELCSRHNVLLIADEVITGFGRTGRWFAKDHWSIQPDILTFAKGVTSGYLPLGGMLVSPAIKSLMDSVPPMERWMHAYTYSGHPACCAVALKNLDIIEAESLCENSERMGTRLHSALLDAFSDHPHVGDIRGGKGLLAAVELVEDRGAKKNFPSDRKIAARLQSEMMGRGVVTRTRASGGPHPAPGDAVYFAPPLVVTAEEVDRLVNVCAESLSTVLDK